MKKEVITTAKTVEEAVEKAVAELGAPSADKIEYTVLEEPKKGFLGLGACDAKISASYVCGGEARALAFVEQLLSDMEIEAEVTVADGENGEKRISLHWEKTAKGYTVTVENEGFELVEDIDGLKRTEKMQNKTIYFIEK